MKASTGKRISVYLNADEFSYLQEICEKRNVSFSTHFRDLLRYERYYDTPITMTMSDDWSEEAKSEIPIMTAIERLRKELRRFEKEVIK